jgi:hypothetical protein
MRPTAAAAGVFCWCLAVLGSHCWAMSELVLKVGEGGLDEMDETI